MFIGPVHAEPFPKIACQIGRCFNDQGVVMDVGLVRDRLTTIEQYVDQAAQACARSNEVPDDLRSLISELERESDQARQMIEVEQRDDQVRARVDGLEELGDRAMRSCNNARKIDQHVQAALTRAHDMLSTLKHELH